MQLIKKIFLVLITTSLIFSSFLSLFANNVKAQEIWYDQSFGTWYGRVYDSTNPDEVFGERYAAANVQWIFYGLAGNLINAILPPKAAHCVFGPGISNCIQQLLSDNAETTNRVLAEIDSNKDNSSFIEKIVLAEKPFSAIGYFKNLANKLNPIKEVHAQTAGGFGINSFDSILRLWTIIRNITYIFFVVFVLVLAFMVMFRVRTSPQTAITLQSALVSVVIGLILVTFSYAIAGFLLDLMYVFIGILALIFGSSGLFVDNQNWRYFFDILTIGPELGLTNLGPTEIQIPATVHLGIGGLSLQFMALFYFALIVSLLSSIGIFALFPPTWGAASLFSLIATILVSIVLLIAEFRIMILLFRTYARILLLVAFSPIIIGLGVVVPNIGFRTWLRDLIASLAVFPVIGTLFMLAFFFLGGGYHSLGAIGSLFSNFTNFMVAVFDFTGTAQTIIPPTTQAGIFEGQRWVAPFMGGRHFIGVIWVIVSLILITMIPSTAQLIQSIIQGQPFNYGAALGQALGPARTAAGMAAVGPIGAVGERVATKFGVGTRARRTVEIITEAMQKKVAGG